MEAEYKTLTRRELQGLCKQHGLPANLTNARMAENLASLLQKKHSSQEIKPKGCLKGSAGSSDEGTGGRRGVPKKVSFDLQEDTEREGGGRDLEVGASPARKRSSRRRGNIEEGSEAAVEAEIDFQVKTRRKECRSGSEVEVLSPVVEKKSSRKRNHEADAAEKTPCTDENNGRMLHMRHGENAPITRALRNRVVKFEGSQASEGDAVPRRTQTRRNVKKKDEDVVASLPDVNSMVAVEGSHSQASEGGGVPRRRQTRSFKKKEEDVVASLHDVHSTVTVEGSQALGDAEPRRTQTRRNVKKQEKEVKVSLPDMSLGAKELENDEDLNKGHSKQRKGEIHAAVTNEQNASIVSQTEEPPLRRSKRNLAKFCKVIEELEISSVVQGSNDRKLGDTAEQQTEEAAKIPRRSIRTKGVASRIGESDAETSLPDTCETLDGHQKMKAQKKARKSAKSACPFVSLPDVMLTAAKDVGQQKLPDVEEHSRRFTGNSSAFSMLEHEASLSNFCTFGLGDEIGKQNMIRNAERTKKTRKGASDNMAAGFTSGDSFQEPAFWADGKTLAPCKNILRRSMRNVPTCPSAKFEVLVPAKSSENENKKEKSPKHTAPELLVSEIAKSSDRAHQALDEPPLLQFSGDCTVGTEDGIQEGDNHIETSKRKQKYNVGRRDMMIAAEMTTKKSKSKKRKGAACSEDDSSVVNVGTYTGFGSAKAPQEKDSSDGTKNMLHVKNLFSPGLTVLFTEELSNFITCNNITVDVTGSKKQSSDVLENSGCNKINDDHQLEKENYCLHREVEPVAFLDSHEMTGNVDSSLESAQPSSPANLSVQDLFRKAPDNNFIDSSAHKGQSSLSIYRSNSKYLAKKLVKSGGYSLEKDFQVSEGCLGTDAISEHTGDDTRKMVKEDQELCPCKDIEMSCFLNGSCVEDVDEDITIAGECGESEDIACMDSTMEWQNYSQDRGAQHKETNVIKLCLPGEFSPATDTVASFASDSRTASMPANVHGLGEISSYSPICASSLKDGAAVSSSNDLLDLSDQKVVSKNEFGSCVSASSLTSAAESGCNELHGLEELSVNTVYSSNPQRHGAADRDGLSCCSPSNLLTKVSENVVESSGQKHGYFENKDCQVLESNDIVPHSHPCKVRQDGEIEIPIEDNQNSSMNVTGPSSCNTLTQYDSSEPIAKRKVFSPLKLVEVSSDIKETSRKVKDASRAVLEINFSQIRENGLSPHVDLVTTKEHSGLNINSEESCSDVVGVISMTISDILDEVSDTFLHTECVREIYSERKSSDRILTPVKAEYKFEKRVETQKGLSEIMHLSSASSIGSFQKEPIVDITPCISHCGKNKRMEDVRSPSSIGGTSQLKRVETRLVEKEDPVDTLSLCNKINSSSIYQSFNSGKTSTTLTMKMSDEIPKTLGYASHDDNEDHIFNSCFSTCENSSEGNFEGDRSTTLVPDNERKTGEDSTYVNNLIEVIGQPTNTDNLNIGPEVLVSMKDHQLEFVGPPLCGVLSTGRNSCLGDEFSGPTHASCESSSQDENDASNKVRCSLSILIANHVMYNGDTTKPNKRENSAALESPVLQFQSPFYDGLTEMKDVVDQDGVKNDSLDPSNGFSDVEYEPVKSLSKESSIIIEDRKSVLHLDKPLSSPRTQGLCGDFRATSYMRETLSRTPDGQDSPKFEDKIPPSDHVEASCINEERDDEYVSMVLRQGASCRFFKNNEADKIKDMGEEIGPVIGNSVDEEEQEQLVTLCNNSGSQDRNSGSRTFVEFGTILVPSKQTLGINNLIPSNVVPQAAKHQLDSSQQSITSVPEEALIAKHLGSEEISKKEASDYIVFNKLECDHNAKEYSITNNGALDAKNGEILISLQQQHDGSDHIDESSEQVDASQINTDLASIKESERNNCSNSDCSADRNIHDYHKEDKSTFESPGGVHSLNKVFDISEESKQQEAWVAPGASLLFVEDLFHVETKQSLFTQPVFTGHTSADDSYRHEFGYSSGRSRELNMIEKMKIDSFKTDVNIEKEYEERANFFTTVNDDLKTNSDVTMESESENPAGCSHSKSMDRVENQASRAFYEESSPKGTGSAIEDKDRNSVECSTTVSEKYLGTEERFNEKENVDEGALEVFRHANKSQSSLARNHMIQDGAVKSALDSIPRVSLILVNNNATCEMEKSSEDLTAHDNNSSQTSITAFDVADDTCIPRDALALPEKQAEMNSMDAGTFSSSGESRRTNDASQTNLRSSDMYVADDTCALNELESTSILGTPGDTLSDEKSDMNSIEASSFSSPGAPSATGNHNTVCEDDINNPQEFVTGTTTADSYNLVADLCTSVNEFNSTSGLGTPGDKMSLPDKQVDTNSIDAKTLSSPSGSFTVKCSIKFEIKKFDEIITGKTNDTHQMCASSFDIAAEADTWTGLKALETGSAPLTPKNQLVLVDEKANSITTDAGSNNHPGASSVRINHSSTHEIHKDQEVIGRNIEATPQTILRSHDRAADTNNTSPNELEKESVPGTTKEEQEQAKLTDVEVIKPDSTIVEAVLQEDTLDKVEKLHLATLNMKHLLRKARIAVASSQPILETTKVQSNSEHRVSTEDPALQTPGLSKIFGPKWEDEISRKLLDFRISSARRTIKPVAIQETPSRLRHYIIDKVMMGKENNGTPASIRKEEFTHKLHADESTKKSARRPLQSINHN